MILNPGAVDDAASFGDVVGDISRDAWNEPFVEGIVLAALVLVRHSLWLLLPAMDRQTPPDHYHSPELRTVDAAIGVEGVTLTVGPDDS